MPPRQGVSDLPYDPRQHHRRSIRLKGYDYSSPGDYFVTICTHNRECILGRIENGKSILNEAGRSAQSVWEGLPARWPTVTLDTFVVMPNHIHGIITIVSSPDTPVGAQFIAPCRLTLGEIVRQFKAISARLIRKSCCSRFAWQRNYYEHIVRNSNSLYTIAHYIEDNPRTWLWDHENPNSAVASAAEMRRVLAKHYGIAEEELSFLIDYVIKCDEGEEQTDGQAQN